MLQRVRAGLRKWEWDGLTEPIDTIRTMGLRDLGHIGTSAELDKEDGIMRITVGKYTRKTTDVTVQLDWSNNPTFISAIQTIDPDISAAATRLHRTLELAGGDIVIDGDLGRHALWGALNQAEALLTGHPETGIIASSEWFGPSEIA